MTDKQRIQYYKVLEKPHKTFPYEKGNIISFPNDIVEWVGEDKKLRQIRLSNNFRFEKIDHLPVDFRKKEYVEHQES